MPSNNLEKIRAAHRVLTEFRYETDPVIRGYANRTLYINVGSNSITSKPVSRQMKDLFTGGRGFCLWLLWNAVNDDTHWDDPLNELVFSAGPIAGISNYPGTGKTTVVTISPLTKSVIDSNGGGYFGPYLKFSGWDALEIQGKAEKDVIILIDGDEGLVKIEEAPLEELNTHQLNRQLTEMYAKDKSDMRSVSVVSSGQAADYVAMCGLNLSYYDPKRDEVRIKQAARGGAGRVLRDKRIKAIIVRYSRFNANSNGVADMELLRKAGKRIHKELADFDAIQNDMASTGTTYLVNIMNEYDLLPVENFRYGRHEKAHEYGREEWKSLFDRRGPDGCWYGCSMACAHGIDGFQLKTGPYCGERVFVDGPEYETIGAVGSNLGIFDRDALVEINFYCDTYGIDTISLGTSLAFVMECYEEKILDDQKTGGLKLTWGNADAVLDIVHQMAHGEKFGMIVGQGTRAMKRIFTEQFGADPEFLQDIGMEVKGLEASEYLTKESLTQQGGYAIANKGAQHDEAWLIFMELVHKQLPTFEAKAEALYYFPMFRTWFSLQGLCKLPWNDITPASNKTSKEPAKVPEHVENYCWLYEGVTGNKLNIEELLRQSERVYTFQRLFNLRLGFGRRENDYPPYRMVGPVTVKEYESRSDRYDRQLLEEVNINPADMTTTEKIKALRNYKLDRYEKLLDTVYQRRGWTIDGIPSMRKVKQLSIDIPEVMSYLRKYGG